MQPRRLAILMSVCVMVMGVSVSLAQERPSSADGLPPLGRWVIASDTGHYLGYYVGGGSGHPSKAEPRRADEGTWGWDYQGWLVPRRVVLGWWHGRRNQGGTGAYKTDGPRLYHEDKDGK